MIVLLAWLNIRGIGESAKLNFFLAVADLVTQVLIIIVGAFLVLEPVAAGPPGRTSARCRATAT